MINRVCGRGGGPPDFRNFSDKSPNHLVYSPTIAPLPPKAGASPAWEKHLHANFHTEAKLFCN